MSAISAFPNQRRNRPAKSRAEYRLEVLTRVAETITSDLDLERTVQSVTDIATELCGAQFGAFFYNVVENGESYLLYSLSGAPRDAFEKFGLPRNTAVFEPTFRGKGVVRSDDIRKDPRYGKNAPHYGMPKGHLPVVSYLAAPVISRTGEVIGGLFFGHEQAGVFTEDSEEVLSDIAKYAAIAIDNARLFQSAQNELAQRYKAEESVSGLASIVESSHDAIVSKNLDGFVKSWNRAAERIFGYTAEEMVGQHISKLIPEDRLHEEPRIIASVRRGDLIEHYETVRRRKDGTLFDVSLTVSPVRNRDGKIIGASKIARDVTQRKRAEESLARSVAEQAALYQFTDRLHRAESLDEVFDSALDTILQALRCQKASILLFDSANAMKFAAWRDLSEGYRQAVEGHSPWTPDAADPHPICIEDVDSADLSAPLKATITHEGIRALAFIPLLGGGKVIGKFMTYYSDRHAFTDSERNLALTIARQLGFRVERIKAEEARTRAEKDLRESEQRLQLALEAGRMGAWEWDLVSNKIVWSPGLEEIHGLKPGTFGGTFDDYTRDVHPDDLQMVLNTVRKALEERDDYHVTYRMKHPDGGERWLEAFGRLAFGPDGNPAKLAGICMDITERKWAESQRELLVAELSHRVKNTLATVISIQHQSFAMAPSLEEAREAFDSRIRALAQTHSRLAEGHWSGVPLETALADELSPYRQNGGSNIRLEGPRVILSPRTALTLGMAIHELATNAAKYGALSVKEGVVQVTWEKNALRRALTIHWTETGGPKVEAPARRGFGRLLLERALASDLKGKVELDFHQDGLKCNIVLPLE